MPLSSLDNFNTVVDTTYELSEIPRIILRAQAEVQKDCNDFGF